VVIALHVKDIRSINMKFSRVIDQKECFRMGYSDVRILIVRKSMMAHMQVEDFVHENATNIMFH